MKSHNIHPTPRGEVRPPWHCDDCNAALFKRRPRMERSSLQFCEGWQGVQLWTWECIFVCSCLVEYVVYIVFLYIYRERDINNWDLPWGVSHLVGMSKKLYMFVFFFVGHQCVVCCSLDSSAACPKKTRAITRMICVKENHQQYADAPLKVVQSFSHIFPQLCLYMYIYIYIYILYMYIYNIHIQYTIYNIQYTIYNMQYAIYNIQYTIYNNTCIHVYTYTRIYIYYITCILHTHILLYIYIGQSWIINDNQWICCKLRSVEGRHLE